MKDINEIIKTIVENAKKFDLSYTNITVHDKIDNIEITVDIRVNEYKDSYGVLDSLPRVLRPSTVSEDEVVQPE